MAEIHEIQERIYEETKHISTREKVAYFRSARKESGLTVLVTRRKQKRV
jgi:hypothetical protein